MTKIRLAASVPCKRFDFTELCDDGSGGWTFSQFGVDRYVSDPANFGLKLGLAIYAQPTVPKDYIEFTRLTARMNNKLIAISKLDWKIPNDGAAHHRDGSIYEWVQTIDAPVSSDGMLEIEIAVKLNSQKSETLVDGVAYVHVTIE